MKLTLIQLDGRNIAEYRQTAGHILELTEKCCKTGTDLILLPECAYPGYFIGLAEHKDWLKELPAFEEAVRSLARMYGKYIGIGLPVLEGGRLYNALCLYDRTGARLCAAAKSNLWHFDSGWFTPGKEFDTAATEFGTIGCMVCADGRIPEAARALRLGGARLILDAVNLVACAPVPEQLSNQQYTFILQQRARENGVYIAVCGKCGVEDHSVTMLGRSMVIDPEGRILAQCSPDREELLSCEIDLSTEHPILPRKEGEYGILSQPTQELPIWKELHKSFVLSDLECYTAVVRFPFENGEEYLCKAQEYVRIARKASCRLAVLPYAKGIDLSRHLPALAAELTGGPAVLIGYGERQAAALLCGGKRTDDGGSTGAIAPAGTDKRDGRINGAGVGGSTDGGTENTLVKNTGPLLKDRCLPIFNGVNLAVLFDGEMEVPENPRVCMLRGADILIWYDGTGSPHFQAVMQTRSAENRVYSLRNTPCAAAAKGDRSLLITPDGGTAATTFAVREQTVFGMICTAASRSKTVVPGTDVVRTRIPEAYGSLV